MVPPDASNTKAPEARTVSIPDEKINCLPGCFITLEGGEGAGKTTQLSTITAFLQQRGIRFISTREPGGTRVSEAIRAVLLATDLPAMHADTELMLMFAARNEHLQQLIIPALQRGEWVICDRFTDASYAYQGYGRGLSLPRIAELEQWVQGSLRPDFTLLFDIDVQLSRQRAARRNRVDVANVDRFEQETCDFHEKIRAAYLQRAAQEPQRFIRIDASQTQAAVGTAVQQALSQILTQRAAQHAVRTIQ